jgi:HPt (histidine-containing phosphotransfer) domain-containing protein
MVPVSAPESPILDVCLMANIRSLGAPGEADVYAEVAHLFLIDVPVHLSALNAAITAADRVSVWQIAHRLRGSTLEMGALRMAPLCAAIEDGAREQSLADLAAQAERLDREFVAARAAMELAIR